MYLRSRERTKTKIGNLFLFIYEHEKEQRPSSVLVSFFHNLENNVKLCFGRFHFFLTMKLEKKLSSEPVSLFNEIKPKR
jgi:hypothetical protein